MKNLTRWTLAGALAALVVMPGRAEAQGTTLVSGGDLYNGLACGGTEFEFCADVHLNLYTNGTDYWYELVVKNLDTPHLISGDTFTRIGLVNLPLARRQAISEFIGSASQLDWGDVLYELGGTPYDGSSDGGENWVYDGNEGLNGPFPKPTTAFVAVPGIMNGMDDGYAVAFRFNVTGYTGPWGDLTVEQQNELLAVGWGIHSQGIEECSSKMGAWDGGAVNQPDEELSEECYPVPEPGTNALLAIGMVGLAFVAVRRRSLSELLG